MSGKKVPSKYCVVPKCLNTSKNSPEKLFISLPSDTETRKVWQKAMRRDVFVSDKSHVHCCEDHFKVKEDIENYMYIKTMKRGNIRIKPGVIPRFFDCQKNRGTTHISKPRSVFLQKKAHQSVINSLLLGSKDTEEVEQKNRVEIEPNSISKEIGVQVCIKAYVRSKAVQCTSEDFLIPKKAKKKKMYS